MNRNYQFRFGKGASSGKSCSEIYRGEYPFSEPETRAIRDFITGKKDEIKFVYNFHGMGN